MVYLNQTIVRRLKESHLKIRVYLRTVRENLAEYDALVESGRMTPELREELSDYWLEVINRKTKECQRLQKMIQRGYNI